MSMGFLFFARLRCYSLVACGKPTKIQIVSLNIWYFLPLSLCTPLSLLCPSSLFTSLHVDCRWRWLFDCRLSVLLLICVCCWIIDGMTIFRCVSIVVDILARTVIIRIRIRIRPPLPLTPCHCWQRPLCLVLSVACLSVCLCGIISADAAL